MLSKCLNPACSRPFRYLHEGRVFNVEIPARKLESGATVRRIENF